MMMKMHGLSDNIHWFTSYVYFLMLSIIYMSCLVVFGSVVGKKLNTTVFNLKQ